jgi:hypothetical protein
MGKRIMTDVLIVGSAITGFIMVAQFLQSHHLFMLMLALINIATAVFLRIVVRPLLMGRIEKPTFLTHASLLMLLGGWSGAFWVEYLTISHLPSALAGAVTWSLAAVVYAVDLMVSKPAS